MFFEASYSDCEPDQKFYPLHDNDEQRKLCVTPRNKCNIVSQCCIDFYFLHLQLQVLNFLLVSRQYFRLLTNPIEKIADSPWAF